MACLFCRRTAKEPLIFDVSGEHACPPCATRLGRMLVDSPRTLRDAWPELREDDDDREPEPKIRLPDGRTVELREHTEALKRDLTPVKRLQLARTLGQLGLRREQILELGQVLSAEPPSNIARAALTMLMTAPGVRADVALLVRGALFPD